MRKDTMVVIVIVILIGSGLFYWFQIRPAKIKHDCSWTKVIDQAVPEQPAITKEEAQTSQQQYEQCKKDPANINDPINALFACNNIVKQERPAIPAKPEGHWYRQATTKEYDFCVHEHGL